MSVPGGAIPKISVVMACYNGGRWLDEAIRSVLSQTYSEFEFIIINDGSLDNSLQIMAAHAEADSRIVLIDKKNTGLADSLNVGISRARGHWIARLDADDISEATRLEFQLRLAESRPSIAFVGSALTLIDDEGLPGAVYIYPPSHGALLYNLNAAKRFPPHSSAFFTAQAFHAVGGYRQRIKRAEDNDLWLRLSEVGELASVVVPLVRIRKHANQISHDAGGVMQHVDARIARVSYWLRQLGVPDPVDGTPQTYERFRVWVHQQLGDTASPEHLQYAEQVARTLSPQKLTPGSIFRLAALLVSRPRAALVLIWRRIDGGRRYRRLAKSWAAAAADR